MSEKDEIKVHMVSKKKSTHKPAKPSVPHNRGRMMDFAPRRHSPVRRPAKPKVVIHEVETEVKAPSIPEPIISKPVTSEPPKTPAEEAREVIETTTVETVALPGYVEEREKEPTLSPEDIQRAEPVEPVGSISYHPVPPAHDPNSPFLSSVNVEKRPLSEQPLAPASAYTQYAEKNVYQGYQDELKPHHKQQFNQTEILPDKKSPKTKVSMILLIIATVLLGIAIGVLVYFAVFSNK